MSRAYRGAVALPEAKGRRRRRFAHDSGSDDARAHDQLGGTHLVESDRLSGGHESLRLGELHAPRRDHTWHGTTVRARLRQGRRSGPERRCRPRPPVQGHGTGEGPAGVADGDPAPANVDGDGEAPASVDAETEAAALTEGDHLDSRDRPDLLS